MNCPHCQTPNPAQARFCLACATPLVSGWVCTTCHTLLPAHARFCFHCGAAVVPPTPGTEAPTPARPVPVEAREAALPQPTDRVRPKDLTTVQLPAPRPIQDMLPSLQQYLPHHLFEPLERSPNDRELAQACSHLTALLRTAKTYLPHPVVLEPQPAGVPAGGMRRGVFLFGDVSGFTPLSEQLKPLGQEGAEQITRIINALFTELVKVLFAHGGSLLKFGGDALLGLFPAQTDEEMALGALRATQAGLAMQQVMKQAEFVSIQAGGETRALRIKCGISAGRYFAAHLGTQQSMAYVTTGHTVNQAEQAEGHANPGDVVLTGQAYDLLSDRIEVGPPQKEPEEGFYLVHRAPLLEGTIDRQIHAEPPDGDVHAQMTYLVERLDRLSPYLAADLLPRIVTNPQQVRIAPDHRPVTVMFANYAGVGDLIEDLGETHPELITRHLNDYFVHMAQVVERYDGSLARMDQYSVGDRLVIFFGAPRAHEDDPRRAIATALEMKQATRQHFAALQTDTGIYRFEQRFGVNTGHLFAGNVGAPDLRQEYTLMGDDINMAARLMSVAEFGEILISDKTQERVRAFFDLEDRGQLKVKGKDILISTFHVQGARDEIGRTRGLPSGESPLVDRSAELEALKLCGERLFSGRGQIVSIIGDSGLGKSRLMREAKARLAGSGAASGALWLEGFALSFSERVSYWLIVQVLRAALGLKADANPDDALFSLWKRGEELLGKEVARDAMPFLANLMGLPLREAWEERVKGLDAQVRQKQTFWAARQFFRALARQQPAIVALDDLHWADEASLALLEDLLSVTDQAPLMFCLVLRPRRDKGCWHLRDKAAGAYLHRYTEVALEPLTESDSLQLLAQLVPGAEFSPQTQREILGKTAGNPFYLEEVINSLIEDGAIVPDNARPDAWQVTSRIDEISVPDSLQGAILARIDRLTEDARQALQMAAVIGRRFQAQILTALTQAEAELEVWLAQLERSALIRPAELDPEPVYAFPDALVQEVAYESLLVQRRQEFHRRIAETLEGIYAQRLDQECELLAYHFARSDDRQRAAKYLEMAGQKAQAEFANETALRHFEDLLALLGDGEETWQQRFALLLRRQQLYGLTGQQEARQADLETMQALADDHKDEARRSDLLNELADLYQWTGRYAEAERAAQTALEIKTRLNDPAGQASALHQLGVLSYYRGDYDQARTALERAVSLRQQVDDPKGEAWSLMYLGMIDFFEGDYSSAAQLHQRALEMAQTRRDWFQEGIHLTNAARVSLRLGEYEQALVRFQRSLEMKRRVGDRTGQGFSLYYIGLSLAYLGRYDEAQVALQQSLELRREIGDERGTGYSLYGLGLVALGQEQLSLAEDLLLQAYDIHARLDLKAESVLDLSFLGLARLKSGSFDEAIQASEQAMALLAEQKNVEEVQQVYLNHFRVLAARRAPLARRFLQIAYDTMLSQASRIAEAGERQTFLAKVKVNQEIQAAVDNADWDIQTRI